MPNFNSEKYLSATVKSVLSQNFKSWELIIVDDNSNQKTIEILKKFNKYKKIKVKFLKKNKGAAYCRNIALKKARGNYLAFLDSDDLWNKKKLYLQYNFMKKNNFLFSYTNYQTFGTKKKIISPPSKYNFSTFVYNTSIATSSMMILKKSAQGIKFTNTKICEDYYFKCKLLKKIKFAYCLKKNLTKYRIRNNSLQSNNLRNFYWMWHINKNYNNFNFVKNFFSLIFISLNSIKKYHGKNFY